ncbi:MAG: acylneuraminate cytidylyltransferase family protein [Alphaproteobacteria bacterium]|nr:acylneuraminate cytidylyltransferase family protein [Alphaproteobacteria bacterium]
MYQNKKICAIITARAGSKGIKDKNLYPIKGKPLINYTIEAAQKSKYLDDIYCTTDGLNIKENCLNAGINVIDRPKELALDTSKSIDCIVHAIDEIKKQGKEFDYILQLQPTSPLRQPFHIDGIIEECINKNLDSMLSVHQVEYNPILVRFQENEKLTNILNRNSTVRRQDMPKTVYVNGMLYLSKTDLLNLDTSLNDIPNGYEVDPHYALDINDMHDIELAEIMLKEIN